MIYKELGKYYISHPNMKTWKLSIRMPEEYGKNERLCCMFDEEEEPDIDDLSASEVVELIAERFKLLFVSDYEENEKRIAWCRENKDKLNN